MARHSWDITMDGDDAIEICTHCGLKRRKRYNYTGGGVRLIKTGVVTEYFIDSTWGIVPSTAIKMQCKNKPK